MTGVRSLQAKLDRVWPHLDERARRLFAAREARQLGHGGVSIVSRRRGGIVGHPGGVHPRVMAR